MLPNSTTFFTRDRHLELHRRDPVHGVRLGQEGDQDSGERDHDRAHDEDVEERAPVRPYRRRKE